MLLFHSPRPLPFMDHNRQSLNVTQMTHGSLPECLLKEWLLAYLSSLRYPLSDPFIRFCGLHAHTLRKLDINCYRYLHRTGMMVSGA